MILSLPASFCLGLVLWALPTDDIQSPRAAMAIETIDADDIHAYIGYMASDAQYGRNAGTEGNARVAEWAADFFKKAGLKPGGDNGTFLQSFSFSGRGDKGNRQEASNVIALWEGSDPVLKHEVIVVGGHMDHVGSAGQDSDPGRIGRPSKDDRIWNGADDNASGSSAVLEIAQAFALTRLSCKRSILFILFNAEEHGLYGSRYYVEHPLFPLQDTVAMINLDMIGRNPDRPVHVIGAESADNDALKDLALSCSSYVEPFELTFTPAVFGGSDHESFLKRDIPVVFFFSGLHRDYHQINDETDRIDCQQVMKVSKTVFLMVYQLANQEKRLAFNPLYKPGFGGSDRRRLLGIDVGERVKDEELEGLELGATRGAVRVDSVYRGMPARAAGLKKGDLILRIGEVAIERDEPVTSLRSAIDGAPAGVDVPVEILRKGEVLVLNLKWKK